MRPGDTTHRLIRVTNPATGAGVTGLVIGDFTVLAKARGYAASVWSNWTHASALVEIGSGYYALAFAACPSAGWWRYLITSDDGYDVWSNSWEGEVEAQDLDSMYTGLSAVALGTPRNVFLGFTWPAELFAYRYGEWEIPVVDQTGEPVDLSGYTNLKLAVRSLNQTTYKLDAEHGTPTGFVLTGSAGGIVNVSWPESVGSGAADIYAVVPPASLTMSEALYYEITGDVGGDATKTIPIVSSSPLTVRRREVGS
jgi:hypothetical protein